MTKTDPPAYKTYGTNNPIRNNAVNLLMTTGLDLLRNLDQTRNTRALAGHRIYMGHF